MHPYPTTLAQAVRFYRRYDEGREGAFSVLLDEFVDAFCTEKGCARRQAMIDDEPSRIGEEGHNAYIGAVGEHLARGWCAQILP